MGGLIESVKRLFDEAKLEAIDRRLWEGWCRHVKDIEAKQWEKDRKIDGIEAKQWEKDRKIDGAEPLVIFDGEDGEAEEDTSLGISLDESGLDHSVLYISGVGVLGDISVLETSVEINMEDLGEKVRSCN